MAFTQRRVAILLAITTLLACSGPGSDAAGDLEIQPPDAEISPGDVVDFDAFLAGSAGTDVTWTVQEPGGGTVDETGMYVAPDAEGTFHVVASRGDQPDVATAVVLVKRRSDTGPGAVTVSPKAASVTTGESLAFTATVSGPRAAAVTWSVEEGAAGGTVTDAGGYTAPAAAGTFHVVARSVVDPTRSDRATVTVTAPPPAGGGAAPPAPPAPAGMVPAFPGAQGGGSLSRGGRGGVVYEVTNLNDSGVGSLRACVQGSGPRTCVFKVGGTIVLRSTLWVVNPYITIAGQTAPGDGIQLVGPFSTGDPASPSNATGMSTMVIATHDVIMRYVRARHGLVRGDLCAGSCDWARCRAGDRQGGACYAASIPDTINLSPAAGDDRSVYNVVLDHVSAQWGEGKGFGIWNGVGIDKLKNITIQYGLVGETLRGNSTGFIAGTHNPGYESTRDIANSMVNIDWHHNLGVNTSHRFPLVKVRSARWVNNLVYNWALFATQIGGGVQMDLVSNLYKKGPMTGGSHEIQVYPWTANTNPASGDPSLYIVGNKGPYNPDPAADNWGKMTYFVVQETAPEGQPGEYVLDGSRYKRTSPMPAYGAPITATPVANLESLVLAQAGASARLTCEGTWVGARDRLDARMVADYVNGTGPYNGALDCLGTGCIPQSEITTPEGGFPVLNSGPPCADADRDGMPDGWELARGLNGNDPSDGPRLQADGYTNLERYLNGQ